MVKRADFVPDALEHRLPRGRVPAVPGCVGRDRAFDRDFVKGEIERSPAIAAAVLVLEGSSASFVVDLRPVLIAVGFGPVRPGGWMRAASSSRSRTAGQWRTESPFHRPSGVKRIPGA